MNNLPTVTDKQNNIKSIHENTSQVQRLGKSFTDSLKECGVFRTMILSTLMTISSPLFAEDNSVQNDLYEIKKTAFSYFVTATDATCKEKVCRESDHTISPRHRQELINKRGYYGGDCDDLAHDVREQARSKGYKQAQMLHVPGHAISILAVEEDGVYTIHSIDTLRGYMSTSDENLQAAMKNILRVFGSYSEGSTVQIIEPIPSKNDYWKEREYYTVPVEALLDIKYYNKLVSNEKINIQRMENIIKSVPSSDSKKELKDYFYNLSSLINRAESTYSPEEFSEKVSELKQELPLYQQKKEELEIFINEFQSKLEEIKQITLISNSGKYQYNKDIESVENIISELQELSKKNEYQINKGLKDFESFENSLANYNLIRHLFLTMSLIYLIWLIRGFIKE